MKRLDEILSKSRSSASSADLSDTSSGTAEAASPAGVCPRCGGAGFVRVPRPVDHPRFGKAEPCECVLNERVEVRQSRLERLSNLGALTRFTFDTLVPGGRGGESDWFRRAYNAALAYAADPQGWLVLTGPSGSGKTHLAAAIANARIAEGGPALFMVVPDLLDHLRASYDAGEDELGYEALFDQVRNAPLLLLDDIDAASGTPWAREKLYQVVNHRYNAELPTVFTCSTRPRQLDDRLATRLTEERLAAVYTLDGPARGAYDQVGGMARERLAEMQFRDFDLAAASLRPEERESLQGAYRAAMAFAERPHGWFTLQGVNGCGKTHLAAAVANKVLGSGLSVFFAVVPDLLDYLRASFAPGKDTGYDELFERIRTAELLILDDFGAQASSPWAQEKLYQIVNYRTVAGLPGVITTDRSTSELAETHARIVARIADPGHGSIIYIEAPHYRLGRMAAGRPGAGPRRPR